MTQPKIADSFLFMKKKREKDLMMNQIIWSRQLFNVEIDKQINSI